MSDGIFTQFKHMLYQFILPILVLFSCFPEEDKREKWVNEAFGSMNPQERIAQLFMAAAYADPNKKKEVEAVKHLIERYKIGSVIWMKGEPAYQVKLTNEFQQMSKVPLLFATDAEWGLNMRLGNDGFAYPYQMTLGAMKKDSLIYHMGAEIAEQFKLLGVHMNFAPVVDVNNNSNNPVISYRSFGEDPNQVTEKGKMYMLGMQDNGLLCTLKHFPGHGDTITDSHHSLPVIHHNIERLNRIELVPFKHLCKTNASGVMIAHMSIPSLDSRPNVPSTLSRPIITNLLKKKMGYNGLIVSDAMNMKALTSHYPIGEADVRSIEAGVDIIEMTTDIPKAIASVQKAIKKGRITQKMIDEKCRKILFAKYDAGLYQWTPLPVLDIKEKINKTSYRITRRKMIRQSLTAIKNQNNLLPIKKLTQKFAVISFNKSGTRNTLQRVAKKYVKMDSFSFSAKATNSQLSSVKEKINSYDTIIISLHQVNKRPGNYSGFSQDVIDAIKAISNQKPTIITYFRNPYTLNQFDYIPNSKAIVIAYQDGEDYQSLMVQALFGAIPINGQLPVSIGGDYSIGTSIETKSLGRLEYGFPKEVGMNSEYLLKKIDSLVFQAIDSKATPGAVVLVAKDGKVVLEKAYGHISYSDTTKIIPQHIYDLASITKIIGALPPLMKLSDEEKFDINQTIAHYQPFFRNSNKENISWRDALGHQAGLHPWIPFYNYIYEKNFFGKRKKKVLRKANGKYISRSLSRVKTKKYPYEFTKSLFLHKNFEKRIHESIKCVENNPKNEYKYSGLSFYLIPKLVEKLSKKNFRQYLRTNFFDPIGAETLGYLPKERLDSILFVPTEYDMFFRYKLLVGEVHDEGAAFMRGVSGNAGLFSNANDLAKMMQMFLNKGYYGGIQYIQPETINYWTSYVFKDNNNRRGLGFDKPLFTYSLDGNASEYASEESYGHTAFTGGRTWVDPKYNLVYIFLTNRVNPTRFNTKIYQLNTRTLIEKYIYQSFLLFE